MPLERETWWAKATSPLEYRIPEEYLLYLRLKKKKKSKQPIPPTLLQYLWGSADHPSRQGDEQSKRWSTQVAKANMERGAIEEEYVYNASGGRSLY